MLCPTFKLELNIIIFNYNKHLFIYKIMILLLLLALFAIYIHFGLFVLVQIIIWLTVFFLSNLLLGINPYQKDLYIIRIMSIIVIVFILWFNYKHSSILTSFILPISIDKITYLDDLKTEVSVETKIKSHFFGLIKRDEIYNFLITLGNFDNYVCCIEFIPNISSWSGEEPQMILSKPFVINKFSSSDTLTKFINERLLIMVDCYCLDDTIFQENGVVVLGKLKIKNIY